MEESQEDVIITIPKIEDKILSDSFKNAANATCTNLQIVLSQVDE